MALKKALSPNRVAGQDDSLCIVSIFSGSVVAAALDSVLAPDAVLVSDSASSYKTAAKALGVVGRQIPSGTLPLMAKGCNRHLANSFCSHHESIEKYREFPLKGNLL